MVFYLVRLRVLRDRVHGKMPTTKKKKRVYAACPECDLFILDEQQLVILLQNHDYTITATMQRQKYIYISRPRKNPDTGRVYTYPGVGPNCPVVVLIKIANFIT